MTARKGVAVATTMPDLLKRTGTGSLQEGLAASLVVHSVDLLSTGGIALSKAGCVCVGGVHSELWQYQTRAVANTPRQDHLRKLRRGRKTSEAWTSSA